MGIEITLYRNFKWWQSGPLNFLSDLQQVEAAVDRLYDALQADGFDPDYRDPGHSNWNRGITDRERARGYKDCDTRATFKAALVWEQWLRTETDNILQNG